MILVSFATQGHFNVLHHKGTTCCLIVFLSIVGLLLLLIGTCMTCGHLFLRQMQSYDPVLEAKALSLYNFAFGCAFDKPVFIVWAVKDEVEEQALQCGGIPTTEWENVAALWRVVALTRTTSEQLAMGTTWPQEPPKPPIYVLLCPSFGMVIGHNPKTRRVHFAVGFERLRFSEFAGQWYPDVQSWETIWIQVWDTGVSWEKLPTAFPELRLCLSGSETPSPGEASSPSQ